MTPNNFFYLLRNAKEDCLLVKNGNIKFNNLDRITDENMSPCLERYIVSNWLEAVGGPQLQEQVFRVYSKDLETCTLNVIRLWISENLEVLLAEAENTAQAGRALAQKASIGSTNAKTPSRGLGKTELGRGMPANRRYQTKPVHWQGHVRGMIGHVPGDDRTCPCDDRTCARDKRTCPWEYNSTRELVRYMHFFLVLILPPW
jgi:hypothetical protein